MNRAIVPRPLGSFLVVCVVCALLGLTSRVAHATNKNPNLIPLGENESFLGNAGVGRANDSGAVYYNPSGLAELPTGRVSVSGAVYASISQHDDALTTLDGTRIPFDASGFFTIPSAYAATRRFGDWVGAFSVLVPDELEFDDHVPLTTPNLHGNLTYLVSESELWLGLSLARKLGERWSVGATVYGINHSETVVAASDFQNIAMPTLFESSARRKSLSTWALSATLGVTCIAADWIRVGLRAQTASVQLAGSVDTFVSALTTAPGAMPSNENLKGAGVNYLMPFDFSLGTAIVPAKWATLFLDASLQLGASYTTIPASATFNNSISLKPTPRLNFGMEFLPTPANPLRIGFFYNPSAEGLDRNASGYERDDFFGLTAGIGLNDEHVHTTVGGFYIWSSGEYNMASERITAKGAMLTTAYIF